jgi:Asp-tRNA(Asn)/Glu-tRNA(Gln) amidotransferase A subunit family amidase
VVAHQLVRPSHSLRKPPANPKTQTNCLTEVLFDEALQQAKGPLHGIPITLKDQFNVKGVDSTLGYVGRSFQPASEDAVLVQILKDMGAIVIAKTNLCQSIMVCMHLLLYYMSINDMDSFLILLTRCSGERRRILSGD